MLTPAAIALTVFVVTTPVNEPADDPAAERLIAADKAERLIANTLSADVFRTCDGACYERKWREVFPDYEEWRERILAPEAEKEGGR